MHAALPGLKLPTVRLSRFVGLSAAWPIAIVAISVVAGLMEAIGLAMLVPIFEFIESDGQTEVLKEQVYWRVILQVFDFFGQIVTIEALLLISFLLIVSRQAIVYCRTMLLIAAQEKITRQIRILSFDGFFSAEQRFHDEFEPGQFVNTLTVEPGLATSAYLAPLRALAQLAVALVYAGTLLLVSPLLSALAVGVLGVSMLSVQSLMAGVQRRGAARLAASEGWTSKILARLDAARLIRMSGTAAQESRKIAGSTRTLERANLSVHRLKAAIDLLIEPIVFLTALVLIYVGIVHLGMSVEAIGVFMVILLRLAPTARAILAERQIIRSNGPSLRTMVRLLDRLAGVREPEASAQALPNPRHALRLEHVSYGHNLARGLVIEDVSLTLPIGHMTALAGPSGAGKTTLLELLCGFRQPDRGRIHIDDVDVTDRPPGDRRALFALVPQSAQLLESTPEGHIRYGNPDLSAAEVRSAAQAAGALDFIERLPDGFATNLGERSGALSGGQRQRLDLARALAQKAPILVLDEPTSQLDSESEQTFLRTLKALRDARSRTILLIGHRLSTVAIADQIVVMDSGRILEIGDHDSLCRAGRWYAKAWTHQGGAATDRPVAAISP